MMSFAASFLSWSPTAREYEWPAEIAVRMFPYEVRQGQLKVERWRIEMDARGGGARRPSWDQR